MGLFDLLAKKEKFLDKKDEFDIHELARLIYDHRYLEEVKSKMRIEIGDVMKVFIEKYFNGNMRVVSWGWINEINEYKSAWYHSPIIKFLKTACDTNRLYVGKTSEHVRFMVEYIRENERDSEKLSCIEDLLYNENYYNYAFPDYLIRVYAFINSEEAMYFINKETGNSVTDDLEEIKAKIGGDEGSRGFIPRHEIDELIEKYKRPR